MDDPKAKQFAPFGDAAWKIQGEARQQAKPGARTWLHVASAMKCFEQLPLIILGNANPVVANHAHGIRSVALNGEIHRRTCLRILHGVAQKIGKNVVEQSFICLRFGWNGIQRQFHNAPAAGRRTDFIHSATAELIRVEGGGLKEQLTGMEEKPCEFTEKPDELYAKA